MTSKVEKSASDGKAVVCFLGPVSSYTHQATVAAFPADRFELVPVGSIKDVFATTQSGAAAYGVVPLENSSNGPVIATLDLLADRLALYPSLAVCAETYLAVHHCLLGRRPRAATDPDGDGLDAAPPAGLGHLRRVYSHAQAFGQCARFLAERLARAERIDVSSTARAAQLVAADPDGASAAIGSAAAAAVLGLDVLARDVEDRNDNTTRFLVLAAGSGAGRDGASVGTGVWSAEAEAQAEVASGRRRTTRSLASFTVPHGSAGALAAVLDCLRKGGLEATQINSRPSLVAPFRYVFLVELEVGPSDEAEGRVRDALESAAKVADTFRWWGSWENRRV